MNMMYIDATDQVAGRLATNVAKLIINGEEVMVFNAEKAVITGNPEANFRTFGEKIVRGDPYYGPFYPKRSDRILKRIIRGMVPRRKARGRDALSRLKVFISVPEEFKDKQLQKIEGAANAHKCKFVTLAQISRSVGVKI